MWYLSVMNAPILCATDFSPGARRAVDLAARVAGAFELPLVLAHVTDLAGLATPEGAASAHEAEHVLRGRLEARRAAAQRELAVEAGALELPCEMVLLDGRPCQALIEYATRRPFSMIVIGAHGAGRGNPIDDVAAVLFGSTAERLVRGANCPVLVSTGSAEPLSLREARWEVAVGEDVVSEEALETAMRWGARIGATLHVRRIVPPTEVAPSFDDALSALNAFVQGVRARLDAPVPLPIATVEVGTPSDVITAHSTNAALVVVGSHRRAGLELIFEGSVADRVLRASAAPVLIVPFPG